MSLNLQHTLWLLCICICFSVTDPSRVLSLIVGEGNQIFKVDLIFSEDLYRNHWDHDLWTGVWTSHIIESVRPSTPCIDTLTPKCSDQVNMAVIDRTVSTTFLNKRMDVQSLVPSTTPSLLLRGFIRRNWSLNLVDPSSFTSLPERDLRGIDNFRLRRSSISWHT